MKPLSVIDFSNTSAPRFHSLQIQDLSLQVSLGCTAEERAILQEVRLSVQFRFSSIPAGARTDALQDTLCYAQISALLQEHCCSREFQLIERLGFECYAILKNWLLPSDTQVALRVHKVRPPVPQLLGGSHFTCGDFAL